MSTSFQQEVFRILLAMASASGRGQALFGKQKELAGRAFAQAAVPGPFPDLYLEFPFRGAPFCDLTVLYTKISPDVRFTPAMMYGYGNVFSWFGAMPECPGCAGLEMDIGEDRKIRAACGLRFDAHREMLEGLLNSCGVPERLEAAEALMDRMPEGWWIYYAGFFAGRKGSPLRMCAELDAEETQALRENPDLWRERFCAFGFEAYSGAMLERMSRCLEPGMKGEIELDLYPDGTLGDTLGLCLLLNDEQADPAALRRDSAFPETLIRDGLADERVRLLPDCVSHLVIPVQEAENESGRLVLVTRFHSYKLKFQGSMIQGAKGYLRMTAVCV